VQYSFLMLLEIKFITYFFSFAKRASLLCLLQLDVTFQYVLIMICCETVGIAKLKNKNGTEPIACGREGIF